jgi:hypothetical protein
MNERDAVKALSLWQPWASLVALGVKTIETRSWSTSYRGPLAIHASKRIARLHEADEAWRAMPRGTYEATRSTENPSRFPPSGQICDPLPLGAVVATCTLVDVVPTDKVSFIRATHDHGAHRDGACGGCLEGTRSKWENFGTRFGADVAVSQRPYGDYTPGRYAWLLADIEPLAEPIPAKGRQGLWGWAAAPSSSAATTRTPAEGTLPR